MFVHDQRMQFYIMHVLMHTFKYNILLYEIYKHCLNILGAGDSTGIVRSSPFVYVFGTQLTRQSYRQKPDSPLDNLYYTNWYIIYS